MADAELTWNNDAFAKMPSKRLAVNFIAREKPAIATGSLPPPRSSSTLLAQLGGDDGLRLQEPAAEGLAGDVRASFGAHLLHGPRSLFGRPALRDSAGQAASRRALCDEAAAI